MALIKLVFFGDTNTGKTCLVGRFVHKDYRENRRTTIGADMLVLGNYSFWDCGSQKNYRPNPSTTYNKANTGVYCIDLSRPLNAEKIEEDIQEFRKHSNARIVLVGTKSDIEALKVCDEEFEALKKRYDIKTAFKCSAKTEAGTSALWEELRISDAILEDVEKVSSAPQVDIEAQSDNEEASPDQQVDIEAQSDNSASIKWMVLSGFVAALGVAAIAIAFVALNLATFGMAGLVVGAVGTAALLGGGVGLIASGASFFAAANEDKDAYRRLDDSPNM